MSKGLHRRLRKNIAINSSERLAETLVMQAFPPEQRRAYGFLAEQTAGKENDAPRLRASISLRRAGGLRTAQDRRRLLPSAAASGDYALGSEHALRAKTFRAADMPWAVDKPSKSVGRRAYLARDTFRAAAARLSLARRTTAARPVIVRKSARRGGFCPSVGKTRDVFADA